MNHRPQVKGTDYAFWRRVRLVPFVVTIPKAEQDRELPQKLEAEADGILTWIVQGAVEWFQDGLGENEAVEQATESYRAEQDVIGGFITSECILATDGAILLKDLYGAYEQWAAATGEDAISKKAFGMRLGEKGLTPSKDRRGQRVWKGIWLRRADDPSVTTDD